jgi:uncharacterized membrane protein YGL010W
MSETREAIHAKKKQQTISDTQLREYITNTNMKGVNIYFLHIPMLVYSTAVSIHYIIMIHIESNTFDTPVKL